MLPQYFPRRETEVGFGGLPHVHCVSLKQKPFHPVITDVDKPVEYFWGENPFWTAAHHSYLQRWLLGVWKWRNRDAKLIFPDTVIAPILLLTEDSAEENVFKYLSLEKLLCNVLLSALVHLKGGGVQVLCAVSKLLLTFLMERLWALCKSSIIWRPFYSCQLCDPYSLAINPFYCPMDN